MIELGTSGARICIIGPTQFHSGAGVVGYGTAETLARSFPISFMPTDPAAPAQDDIVLPNGRRLPVCRDLGAMDVFVLCDVPPNWPLIPAGRLTYAWLIPDSDRLPPRWVELLNSRADAVLVPSPHLAGVARQSGVLRPLTPLPVPLDLDPLLSRPLSPPGPVFTFGSLDLCPSLVAAFTERFGADATVQLLLPDSSEPDPATLLASFDVHVSVSGSDGYGFGPREAAALGQVVVAADVHRDLAGLPGVFLVPESNPGALDDALAAARRFAEADRGRTALARRDHARQWSFSALAGRTAGLIDPSIAAFRGAEPPAPAVATLIERRLGRRADAIGAIRRQVCPAHDGGFFSLFNTFFTHLVWQQREDRCHSVLPDWDVDRFLSNPEAPIRSFCYGQPGDGNLWIKLFQPLFGATDAEMNDPRFLWRHAEVPRDRHNQEREPTLTYVRAYHLYRSPAFEAFRRQYHAVFARHIRLRPQLQAEIDAFASRHLAAPVLIAAHVRHPSHTVEQPDGRIAGADAYIDRIRAELRARGADPDGDGWAVFVATDQDRVLHRFRAAFGDRAVFYPGRPPHPRPRGRRLRRAQPGRAEQRRPPAAASRRRRPGQLVLAHGPRSGPRRLHHGALPLPAPRRQQRLHRGRLHEPIDRHGVLRAVKALVTGATGMLGRALAAELRGAGMDVIALGSADADLRDADAAIAVFARAGPDIVYHLAGRVRGIMRQRRRPRGEAYLDNVRINTNAVEAARLAGARKVVAMGSVAIYRRRGAAAGARGGRLGRAAAPVGGRLCPCQARHAGPARELPRAMGARLRLRHQHQPIRPARQFRRTARACRAVADLQVPSGGADRRAGDSVGQRPGVAGLRLCRRRGLGAAADRRAGQRPDQPR